MLAVVVSFFCDWGVIVGRAQAILVPQNEFFQDFAQAPVSTTNLAPGDQIWIVSTRGINHECQSGVPFQVYEFDGCHLIDSSIDALIQDIQSNPNFKTVVHVHGNFTDFDWAFRRGTEVYKNAIAKVPDRRPVRMIIWSWPSEREAIPLRDFTVKTQRSVYEGELFRQFLEMTAIRTATLIGYSMGAQSVLTSFENCVSGLEGNHQMLLVAPSLSPDFCPMNLGQSLDEKVNRIAILTNYCDRALKNAKRLNRLRHEKFAIDQFSLADNLPVEQRVEVYETGGEVGHKHSIELYCKSPTFQQILASMLQHAE